MQRSIDRRGVSRHMKPLIPAAAPMVLVIAGSAIGRRLHSKFACCCGSAIERISHKSPPAQRQRKENGSVLAKEFPIVRGRRPKDFDAPLWRIFFGGSTPFLLYANKRNGVEKTVPQRAQPFGSCYLLFIQKVTPPELPANTKERRRGFGRAVFFSGGKIVREFD